MKKLFTLLVISSLSFGTLLAQNNFSILLDGTDDHVACDTNAGIGTGQMSLSAWVKMDTLPSGWQNAQFIISRGWDQQDGHYHLSVTNSKVGFFIDDVFSSFKMSSDMLLTTDRWYHIAGTYDGTDMKIYIDGALDKTVNVGGGWADLNNGEVLYLGKHDNGSYPYQFDGNFDEVAIWDSSLTSTEIADIYNCGIHGDERGLKHYFNFETGSFFAVFDRKGSNHGVLLNGGIWSPDVPMYRASDSTFNDTSCTFYSSPSGKIWDTSGVYMDTIPNHLGCDSVMTITLSIVEPTYDTIYDTACEFVVSPSGLFNWDSTGTYYDTIPNMSGCDSIITANIVIDRSYDTISTTACDSLISPSGNYTWTASNTYMDTLTRDNGCDSVLTVNVIINTDIYASVFPTICPGESFTGPDGMQYDSAAVYNIVITTGTGCDTFYTVDLSIDSVVKPTLIDDGDNLNSSPAVSYQWYFNDELIDGATMSSYNYTENGFYTVEVVDSNGCSMFSDEYEVMGIGFAELSAERLKIYPNPSAGNFMVDMKFAAARLVNVGVIDIYGKQVYRTSLYVNQSILPVDISNHPKGLYFLEVEVGEHKVVKKIIFE